MKLAVLFYTNCPRRVRLVVVLVAGVVAPLRLSMIVGIHAVKLSEKLALHFVRFVVFGVCSSRVFVQASNLNVFLLF
jgi:hypothetical protein